MAADRPAASQAGNGLVDNSLENRSCQVVLGRAFVNQRLQIAFGKNPAARRNRIKSLVRGASWSRPAASVCSSDAIWSMKAPVPPAHVPFMRCSGTGFI